MSAFTPTRRSNPCQICSDTTGKCREVNQTLLCMTFADALQDIPGFKFIGQTKDKLWGKWVVDEGRAWTDQEQERWRQEQERLRQLRAEEEAQRRQVTLSADERDRLYRQLLSQLTLHPADRADLFRRGLTQEQITAWGIKSIEQWQRLEQKLPHSLPGVSLDGKSLNTPFPGYLCPVHDREGRIVGFQTRTRNPKPDAPKYYWLTSATKKRPNGAKPHLSNGELPLTIFRPSEVKKQAIAMVEGTGAKPAILSLRLEVLTIGAAGGQFSSSPQTLRQTLDQESQVLNSKVIEFYPDAGAVCNPHVLRQYRATWKLLRTWGYEVRVMWWEQLTKAASDIDELEDFSQIQAISVVDFEAIARQPQYILTQITKLFGLERGKRKKQLRQQPIQAPESTTEPTILEYQVGERLQTWQTAIAEGYRYILDSSTTGTGKSFDAGNVPLALFEDVRQVIYASDRHRNPTVETLEILNGWIDLEARHGGLTRETTANGGSRLRRVTKGETPHLSANCSRNRVVNTLRTKHVSGADTVSLICGTCPLREACAHSEGPGYGFLNQRHSALSSRKLRAHPDSLPAPNEYDYESVVMVWDEPGQTFRIKQDILVTLDDLEQAITTLLKFPYLFESLQPLFAVLLSYLDGSVRLGKFGLSHAQVVEQLPVLPNLDIAAIEQVLGPDLSFLNTTGRYGADLADLPPQLRKKFSEPDSDMAEQAEQRVLKQWLPNLLQVLIGQQKGALSLKQGLLTIALPDTRHLTLAQATQTTIFLDATLNRQDLALKLGCSPDKILEVRQAIPNHNNLTIIQVADLGRMGMQRGKQQQQRAAALVEHYRQLDPDTKVIDFKKYQADGAWWRDSRGVNDFTQIKTLILVGTPCRNVTDQVAEYAILTDISNPEDSGFKAFVDRAILADFYQAIGRLRSHRRASEQLQVILLSDFELDIPTQQVLASDITLEAATKRERFIKAALAALEHLKVEGQKLTQTAVAALTNYSQQYLSRYWKLLLLLLEETNSKSGSTSNLVCEAEPSEVVRVVGQILATVAAETDAPQLLRELGEVLPWLTFKQWKQVWSFLPASKQVKVLSALLTTMPLRQLKPIIVSCSA